METFVDSGVTAWRQVLQLGEHLLALKSSNDQPDAGGGENEFGSIFLKQSQLIVETTRKLLGCEAQIWLSRQLLPFSGTQISASLQEQFPGDPENQFMHQVLEDARKGKIAQQRNFTKSEDCAVLAAPLTIQQEGASEPLILGVLQAEKPSSEPFTDQEAALLAGLATQATIALHASYQTEIE